MLKIICVFSDGAGLRAILLTVAGLLAAIAVLELWLIGSRTIWMLPPLPTSMLMASTAVFSALRHEWQPRAGLATQTETRI
jgi:hypothetical protein